MVIVRTALAGLLLALSAFSQTIQLENGAFKVVGWKPDRAALARMTESDWPSVFAVYAVQENASAAAAADSPPMLGSYSIVGDSVIFQPRFPLSPGLRYRAVLNRPGSAPMEAGFNGPKKDTVASTRVEHVYPSTNVLPANLLKLYIYFSASMSKGEAWKRIHLLDENGKVIRLPFVEIDQELWDPEVQRLTVLFDPGRIKRGLVPNKEVGPPIVEGKQYTLLIDREFLDARGVPLHEEFRKSFRGAAADRTPPDPKTWKITPPKPGTTGDLVVDFPKPMDVALLQRLISVSGVVGTITVAREETQWRFKPDDIWKRGDYQLIVDPTIEDLAGNEIGRAFDVDLLQKGPQRANKNPIPIPFSIR